MLIKIVLIGALLMGVVCPSRAFAQHYPPLKAFSSSQYLSDEILLKGLRINPTKNQELDFIVSSTENNLSPDNPLLKAQSNKLIRYFFAALTVPQEEMWCNLSPFEKDRIIPDALGRVEMGRDLLIQDLMLKQMSASLTFPQTALGKKFWDRIYHLAQSKLGTTAVSMQSFHKVWIMADAANVYENKNTVTIISSHLKVLLEEDYLAKTRQVKISQNKNDLARESQEIMREIILPELEKEVNEGKHFASLRQIFSALILAKWYKESVGQSWLNQHYSKQNKIHGLDNIPQNSKQQIFRKYVKAYQQGAYQWIENRTGHDGKPQDRKYFSGGIVGQIKLNLISRAQLSLDAKGILNRLRLFWVRASFALANTSALAAGNSLDHRLYDLKGSVPFLMVSIAVASLSIFYINRMRKRDDLLFRVEHVVNILNYRPISVTEMESYLLQLEALLVDLKKLSKVFYIGDYRIQFPETIHPINQLLGLMLIREIYHTNDKIRLAAYRVLTHVNNSSPYLMDSLSRENDEGNRAYLRTQLKEDVKKRLKSNSTNPKGILMRSEHLGEFKVYLKKNYDPASDKVSPANFYLDWNVQGSLRRYSLGDIDLPESVDPKRLMQIIENHLMPLLRGQPITEEDFKGIHNYVEPRSKHVKGDTAIRAREEFQGFNAKTVFDYLRSQVLDENGFVIVYRDIKGDLRKHFPSYHPAVINQIVSIIDRKRSMVSKEYFFEIIRQVIEGIKRGEYVQPQVISEISLRAILIKANDQAVDHAKQMTRILNELRRINVPVLLIKNKKLEDLKENEFVFTPKGIFLKDDLEKLKQKGLFILIYQVNLVSGAIIYLARVLDDKGNADISNQALVDLVQVLDKNKKIKSVEHLQTLLEANRLEITENSESHDGAFAVTSNGIHWPSIIEKIVTIHPIRSFDFRYKGITSGMALPISFSDVASQAQIVSTYYEKQLKPQDGGIDLRASQYTLNKQGPGLEKSHGNPTDHHADLFLGLTPYVVDIKLMPIDEFISQLSLNQNSN